MCAWERFVFLQVFDTFRSNYYRIQQVNLVMLEFNLGGLVKYKLFSAVGDTSKLSVFSLWDNLANNPGGIEALLTFFFFGVE